MYRSKHFVWLCMLCILAILITSCGQVSQPDTETESKPSESASESASETAKETETEKVNYIRLDKAKVADKIAGSWIGQMAGVTWSAPTEFHYTGSIIPESAVPVWTNETVNDAFGQDDLYVEIPFLQAIYENGFDCSLETIANYFRDSKFGLAHANYQGRKNLRDGIEPRLCGHYLYNYHADDIDWQIESDYLGNIYPGLVNEAAEKAFEIGHIMNYGDGVYGGVFVAAMHAEAYVTDDLMKVIRAGMEVIPEGTKFRQVLDDVMADYDEGMLWEECWQDIQTKYGTTDKCPEFSGPANIDAKINAAYILIGLLWGEGDFENSVKIAMRCGQDSDCNPSSVAGVLGTLYGLSGIPEKYYSALSYTTQFAYTDWTVRQCIDRSQKLAEDVIKAFGGQVDGDAYLIPEEKKFNPVTFEQWPDDELVLYANATTYTGGQVKLDIMIVPPTDVRREDVRIRIDFGDGMVLDGEILNYTYLKSGSYEIRIRAEVNGKTSEKVLPVEIEAAGQGTGFIATPSCSDPAPQGGGSRDIGIIVDGYAPTPSTSDNAAQYDTYGGTPPEEDWFALNFDHKVTVTDVLFTEGNHFGNGGWFKTAPRVQLLIGGSWTDAESYLEPLYIEVDAMSSQGDPYQTFTFTLKTPTECEGVRVIGAPGGSSRFVSCSELSVKFSHVENPTYQDPDESDPVEHALIICSEYHPIGAGNKSLEVMRDGVIPTGSGNHGTVQYDTFINSSKDHDEYFGYLFRKTYTVTSVSFTEGAHFGNGGWFKDGTIDLELLIDGEWITAAYTLSPKYPNGDSQGLFGANYQTYVFTLDEGTICQGVRVIGSAGGSAHFTSVSELSVETA
ncbi:MAG: ADP-ribosylglycohydrolase family protein [Clostridia bacterium]|nr:ADP-ribosylglycohydrolase family protein [Clostridia bacterium]